MAYVKIRHKMRHFARSLYYPVSLLVFMLAYVFIPHQGDFLDGLSMQPGIKQATDHGLHRFQVQHELMSPFQAVLQGKPLTLASREPTKDCPSQDLEHPEDIVLGTTDPIPVHLHKLPAPNNFRFLPLQAVYVGYAPRPPPLQQAIPRHIPSTILLI